MSPSKLELLSSNAAPSNQLGERERTQPLKNVYDLLESDHLVAFFCKETAFSDIYDGLKENGYYDFIENCTNIFPENFIAEIVKHIARHNELTIKEIKEIALEYRNRLSSEEMQQDRAMSYYFIRMCLAMDVRGKFLIVTRDNIFENFSRDDGKILLELKEETSSRLLVLISNKTIIDKYKGRNTPFIFYNMQPIDSTKTLVYISHKNDNESNEYVNDICLALKKANIKYVIDLEHAKYRNNLIDFEEKIGDGLIVLPVISESYLKSKECMYELAKTSENGHLSQRLFPLITFDIDRSAKGLQVQLKYWTKRLYELTAEAESFPPGSGNICNIDIVRINTILQQLPTIWLYFKEYLTSSKEELLANNCEVLIEEIRNQIE